ncbi:hypothetical protein OH77DRAFT_1299314 [Trametes cingulata]|nr:hypothetical protein OH77DRAFT_1299314 [Trametes cingulata]
MSRGPPWYARDPNIGEIIFEDIPELLLTHPELHRRGITLTDPAKIGYVYLAISPDKPQYAVKVLSPETEEIAIYQRLLRLDSGSPNHTLPCEISQLGHPLLIMPYLSGVEWFTQSSERTLYNVLGRFVQIVEGVEFLHCLNIAHLDLCYGNVLVAQSVDMTGHPDVVDGKLYIIDFDTSRQFSLGPGEQRPIILPSTQVEPPGGIVSFDPYSWDVHCAGYILEDMIETNSPYDGAWITRRYARWLIGNERGCEGICRCRPTARKALQVLKALQVVVYAMNLCGRLLVPAPHARAITGQAA